MSDLDPVAADDTPPNPAALPHRWTTTIDPAGHTTRVCVTTGHHDTACPACAGWGKWHMAACTVGGHKRRTLSWGAQAAPTADSPVGPEGAAS